MTKLEFETRLEFETKKGATYSFPLSALLSAHELSSSEEEGNMYYQMAEALRLLTGRYSNGAKSVAEAGYCLRESCGDGTYISSSTTPEEQSKFLQETVAWAESLSPRELRKSLCSMGEYRVGKRLARIVKSTETIEVL